MLSGDFVLDLGTPFDESESDERCLVSLWRYWLKGRYWNSSINDLIYLEVFFHMYHCLSFQLWAS